MSDAPFADPNLYDGFFLNSPSNNFLKETDVGGKQGSSYFILLSISLTLLQ